MSVKSIIKNHLLSRCAGTHLVFHHVPKTAGTSLRTALAGVYNSRYLRVRRDLSVSAARTADAVARVYGSMDPDSVTAEELRFRYREIQTFRRYLLLDGLESGVPCISGHLAFHRDICEAYRELYRFITVLRDPVQRFVSHYIMNRYRGGHLETRLSFEEYLESPVGLLTANMATDFLSGYADLPLESRLEAARENLECFTLVGSAESLDSFTSRLEDLVGFRLSVPRRRVAEAPEEARKILSSQTLIARVQDLCRADIELYAHARDLFTS
jgi:hypothetical protein